MVLVGEVIFIRQWRNRGPVNYFRAWVMSNVTYTNNLIRVRYEVIDPCSSGADPTGEAYWNNEENPPCWDDGSY